MTLVLYYIFLILSTWLIFKNALKSFKIYNDFILPVSTVIIFYFTLGGAFIFPIDQYFDFQGSSLGLHYHPIFERLFEVRFDGNYFLSVIYYVMFILVIQYTFLILVKKKKVQLNDVILPTKSGGPSLIINPLLVLGMTLSFVFVSAFIFRNEIGEAIFEGKSIYLTTRLNHNPLYTIHQLANEFAVLIPFIAFGIGLYNGEKIQLKHSTKGWLLILAACFISSLYIAILGNRREILSGLVFCVMISIPVWKTFNKKRFLLIFFMSFGLFALNGFFRSPTVPRALYPIVFSGHKDFKSDKPEADAPVGKRPSKIKRVADAAAHLVLSNELFYAHFSMYGVLDQNIPLTYGSSFKNLASSMVPKAIVPVRPDNVYTYYAKKVNAAPDQIYTIHHATAWYLNFGIFGILLGSFILGLLFFFAYSRFYFPKVSKSPIWQLLYFLLPFLVCAQLVTFITAGPEAFKAMLLEGIVIPIILLRICIRKDDQSKAVIS